MDWTEKNDQLARAEGWFLGWTVDNGETVAHLRVFSALDQQHAQRMRWVVERARRGSALHLEAVRSMTTSRTSSFSRKR